MKRGQRRYIKQGPSNSYWGRKLNKFLDGGVYEDFKYMDVICDDSYQAKRCVDQFREFRENYDLPIDIFKIGTTARVMHLKRTGSDLAIIPQDD